MLSHKYKSIEIMQRIQKYCSTKCYKHSIYSIINHLYTQHIKNGKKFFSFLSEAILWPVPYATSSPLSVSLHSVTSPRLSSTHSSRNRSRAWPSPAAPRKCWVDAFVFSYVCSCWSSLFQWLELEAAG